MNKKMKFGTIFSIIGVTIIVAVMLSGAAYPNPIFRIFAPLGLFFVFIGLIFFFWSWVMVIRKQLRSRNYVRALTILVLGILFVIVNYFK